MFNVFGDFDEKKRICKFKFDRMHLSKYRLHRTNQSTSRAQYWYFIMYTRMLVLLNLARNVFAVFFQLAIRAKQVFTAASQQKRRVCGYKDEWAKWIKYVWAREKINRLFLPLPVSQPAS